MRKLKTWDVTLKRFRGIEIRAKTEENARALANATKDPDEEVGLITEMEASEEDD